MGSNTLEAETMHDSFSDYESVYLNMSKAFRSLNKEHWSIHCICSIKYTGTTDNDFAASIRNAWIRLLFEFPGLGMWPIGNQKHYMQVTQGNIDTWAEETFFVSDAEADSIVAEGKPRDLPALYFLPTSSQIVFITQHWRSDGIGACMLLDRLFTLLTEEPSSTSTDPGHPLATPSPSLEDAAGATSVADPEVQSYAKTYIDNFHARAVHAGGLPLGGSATALPSRTTYHTVSFSAAQTTAIVTACRKSNISVTAAIHAALAQTVLSYRPELERVNGYTTVMAVNMRPHLPAPYNSKEHACQTYVGSITPTVPHGAELVEAAGNLTREYQGWWSDTFMKSLKWIYKYHLEKIASAAKTAATSGVAKPPSGVTLSSLGLLERHLRGQYGENLQIEDFRFGVTMMTRQTILYAWTFRGQLRLSLNYNEAFYEESFIKQVVGNVAKQLEGGLGVNRTL